MVAVSAMGAEAPKRAPSPARGEEVVELPPLLIVAGQGVPEWIHVRFPDGEMLAACTVAEARRFAEDFYVQRESVRRLVPPEFRRAYAVPDLLILFDQKSVNVMPADVLRDASAVAPATNLDFGPPTKPGETPAPRTTRRTVPNLTTSREDRRATVIELNNEVRGLVGPDGRRMRFTEHALRGWLEMARPALPAWYVEGMVKVLTRVRTEKEGVVFPTLSWEGMGSRDGKLHSGVTLGAAEIFDEGTGDSAADQLVLSQHRQLLLRWALDGEDPALRARFDRFVARLRTEDFSPALMQECLGLDEAALRTQLDRKLRQATLRPARLAGSLALPKHSIEVRAATRAESESLLSEWNRSASQAQKFPAAARERYLKQALEPVRRLYDQGSRDPNVVTALALAEFEAGHFADAAPLLADAALVTPVRPAVSRALAETALREAVAHPEGNDGRPSAAQGATVLTMLRPGLAQSQPAPQVYLALAHVLSVTAVKATAEDCAALRAGVRFYPEHTQLVLRCSEACARQGQAELARELAQAGLLAARGDGARERLENFLLNLPPEAPPPAAN